MFKAFTKQGNNCQPFRRKSLQFKHKKSVVWVMYLLAYVFIYTGSEHKYIYKTSIINGSIM